MNTPTPCPACGGTDTTRGPDRLLCHTKGCMAVTPAPHQGRVPPRDPKYLRRGIKEWKR